MNGPKSMQLDPISVAVGFAGGSLIGLGLGYKVGHQQGLREGVADLDKIISDTAKNIEEMLDQKMEILVKKADKLGQLFPDDE